MLSINNNTTNPYAPPPTFTLSLHPVPRSPRPGQLLLPLWNCSSSSPAPILPHSAPLPPHIHTFVPTAVMTTSGTATLPSHFFISSTNWPRLRPAEGGGRAASHAVLRNGGLSKHGNGHVVPHTHAENPRTSQDTHVDENPRPFQDTHVDENTRPLQDTHVDESWSHGCRACRLMYFYAVP